MLGSILVLGCRANAQCSGLAALAERVYGRRLRLNNGSVPFAPAASTAFCLVSARLFTVETGGASRAGKDLVSGDN